MTSKEINQALLCGGDQAGKMLLHLLENGVVSANVYCGKGIFKYHIGRISNEISVGYDTVSFLENIVCNMKRTNKKIYRLWFSGDNDVMITRTYSCKKDYIQQRIKKCVQEDQAVLMRSVGYELANNKALKKELDEFMRLTNSDSILRIADNYKVIEV